MGTKEAYKLNLTQCLAIQSNNYTSKDGHNDYDPESIDNRINELRASIASRNANGLRILLDKEQRQYDDFLSSQGVPEFHYTWNDETNDYIMF